MIEFLLSLPVLLKVLGVLSLILLLNQLLKNLLLPVALGALLLGLWSGHSLQAIARIAWLRLVSPNNLLLMVLVLQVIWLSSLMSEAGVMQDLVRVIQTRVPQRLSFAVLPAVIGLLPMPGGAIFSAPLVERCDRQAALPAQLKAQTNYWFRHIWEYWWPLYPSVLLASELAGLEIWQFIFHLFPVTLLAAGSGYWFLLRRIPREMQGESPSAGQGGPSFWWLTAPILVVIFSYAVLQLAFPAVAGLNKYLPMLIGLGLALLVLQYQRRLPPAAWVKTILSKRAYMLVLFVAVVRIYAAIIEAPLPGTPLVQGGYMIAQMRLELSQLGIPLLAVMILIPMISGMAMGLSVGMLGASFPIVLSLLGPNPSLGQLLSTTVLAYSCGFMGVMLSPVHVCFVVTNAYFKTRSLPSLISLIKPVGAVVLGVILFSVGVSRLWVM